MRSFRVLPFRLLHNGLGLKCTPAATRRGARKAAVTRSLKARERRITHEPLRGVDGKAIR